MPEADFLQNLHLCPLLGGNTNSFCSARASPSLTDAVEKDGRSWHDQSPSLRRLRVAKQCSWEYLGIFSGALQPPVNHLVVQPVVHLPECVGVECAHWFHRFVSPLNELARSKPSDVMSRYSHRRRSEVQPRWPSAPRPRSRPAQGLRSNQRSAQSRSTAGLWSREHRFLNGCQPGRQSGSCLPDDWPATRCHQGSPPA